MGLAVSLRPLHFYGRTTTQIFWMVVLITGKEEVIGEELSIIMGHSSPGGESWVDSRRIE